MRRTAAGWERGVRFQLEHWTERCFSKGKPASALSSFKPTLGRWNAWAMTPASRAPRSGGECGKPRERGAVIKHANAYLEQGAIMEKGGERRWEAREAMHMS